jgi:hypothetical protein
MMTNKSSLDHASEYSSADVTRLSLAIDNYPAHFVGNPLNLLFLKDAQVIDAPAQFLQDLDAPSLMDESREYLICGYPEWPFPPISVAERPEPISLSRQLFDRFDHAIRVIPTQRAIGHILQEEAQRVAPDVVVLMIADGLSYFDLPARPDMRPCLVAGITSTGFGYREVIGAPEVARRLFALGYERQIAFTYFTPEANALAEDVHALFAGSQVIRIKAFDEVLVKLEQQKMPRGYIQVSVEGLDQLCHSHRDRPLREEYLKELLQRFDRLTDCLQNKGRSVLSCLTADHGILWRDDIDACAEIVGDLLPEETTSARYVRGSLLRGYGRPCNCLGQNYTLLRYPCLTRKLRNNEWGVHGGISAWESVVPLLIRQS